MSRRRAAVVALSATLALALVACTPTARTAGPYRAKAKKTAEAVHAAVGSDLLLLDAVRRRGTIASFVAVATSDAEDDASSAASTFLSIQTPSGAGSEALRSSLSDLLDDAQAALGDARIAGRRGDRHALLAVRPRLTDIDNRLQRFADQQS